MRHINGLLALCLIISLSSCVKTNDSIEKAYSDEISGVVAEAKNTDLEVVEKPKPEADISEHLSYAIEISPEISALREAELSAKSGVSLAASKARPQLSASSSVGGYLADVSRGDLKQGASITLTASQLLYDGGQTDSGISIAKLQVELASVATESGINRLSAAAARAIVEASLSVKELEAITKFQEEIKPHSAQLERMAASGLIDRSVIDEITSQLLEITIKGKEAKSNLRVSEVSYSKHFGNLPIPNNALLFPLSLSSYIDGELLVEGIPAVRESALRALLAEKQVAVARSAFMPQINAQVGSSSPMDPDENVSAQAGVLISYQFSDGGARNANLDKAKNNLERARRDLEFTLENSRVVLETLQEQVENFKDVNELAKKKLPILADQLRVAETQIQTGQADISKVFDLKLKMNELKSRIRRGQADLMLTRFELAASLGLLSVNWLE